MIHATIRMNLKSIILSETSQTQKGKCMIHLYAMPRTGKLTKTASRIEVTRGWGKGSREFHWGQSFILG